MSSALKTIEAKAHYDGTRHEVFLRSANLGDRVYVDLCDDHWRAIEIDSDGWRTIEDVPVHFRREAGMQPLPAPSTIDPKKGIARLKEVLCLRDERGRHGATARKRSKSHSRRTKERAAPIVRSHPSVRRKRPLLIVSTAWTKIRRPIQTPPGRSRGRFRTILVSSQVMAVRTILHPLGRSLRDL
jgi:hypothetical protein